MAQIEKILSCNRKLAENDKLFHLYYYTLYKLIRNNITKLNRHIIELVNRVLKNFEESISIIKIIEIAYEFIEKNDNLLRYVINI